MKNVLMIAVDDLRPELNCFGKKKLHTPNIDCLAARSVVFERAYCQFPQCMPSRASLMTGLRPKGFCDWSAQLCIHGEPTLPGHLKANGIRTVSAGKVYHEPLDDAGSWDELHMDTFFRKPHGGMGHDFQDYQLEENKLKLAEKMRIGFPRIREIWEPLPPLSECADAPEDSYVDGIVARRAVECLGRLREGKQRGFFLAVGFHRPHLPWTAPRKYWELYDRGEVDLADNPFFPAGGVGKSNLCDFLHYGDREVQERYSDIGRYHDDDFPVLGEAKQRECVHAYWAAVSFMDSQVGRVLDELERLGMADETAVVFWGDNGWHLGEHKLWSKVTHFDESTRVPLLLAVPGETTGERTRGLVELIDVYPTCCELLGLDLPEHLEGRALPRSGVSGQAAGKKHVFSVNVSGRTVLSDRYRLTFYPLAGKRKSPDIIEGRGQYELFDHEKDPRENRNVAGEAAYAPVLEEMKRRLHGCYGGTESP